MPIVNGLSEIQNANLDSHFGAGPFRGPRGNRIQPLPQEGGRGGEGGAGAGTMKGVRGPGR